MSDERVQTRTECTVADLEAWGDSVEIRDEVSHNPFQISRGDQSFPPCLGCGGPVFSQPDGALVVNTTEKTVMFRPCGHVLAVPDMPDGWLS